MEIPKATDTTGEPVSKTRIVVVDEFPIVRHGIAAFLNCQPDMVVCGEADRIHSAQAKIEECNPHLVVIAMRLSTGDSLEFLKTHKTRQPRPLVVVYSAFEEAIFAERAIRAGANGYVMKKAPMEELLAAIRAVLRGEVYVSRNLAMAAFKKSVETLSKYRLLGKAGVEMLSDREIHIFQLIGSGLGTKKIADALKLSVKTIETHCRNMQRKLGLSSSAQLRERATKWVEESLAAEEHVLPGSRRKPKRRGSRRPGEFHRTAVSLR